MLLVSKHNGQQSPLIADSSIFVGLLRIFCAKKSLYISRIKTFSVHQKTVRSSSNISSKWNNSSNSNRIDIHGNNEKRSVPHGNNEKR